MGRTFQYQGLAKVISTPVADPSKLPQFSQHDDALRSTTRIKRFAELAPYSHFLGAEISTPANPATMPRGMDTSQLPVRVRGFLAWYQPSTAWVDIYTLPMPQRAYTCLEMPVKSVRRFAAANVRADAGYPFFTIPIPTRAIGGNDPLPFQLKRIGAAHQPVTNFNPPAVLPYPIQVYQSASMLPTMRRRFQVGDSTGGPWWSLYVNPGASFQPLAEPTLKRPVKLTPDQQTWMLKDTTNFPVQGGFFSQQQVPEPKKRIRLLGESSIVTRDFSAPAFCWSQVSELPQKMKQRITHGETTPFGVLRNVPLMFGVQQYQPTRSKVKPIVDVVQTGHPVTTNEITLPGAWRYQMPGPVKRISSPVWLGWNQFSGPIQTQPSAVPCDIELVGTDNTVVNLTGIDSADVGEGEATTIASLITLGFGSFGSVSLLPTLGFGVGSSGGSGTPAELIGTDNTVVNLIGVC